MKTNKTDFQRQLHEDYPYFRIVKQIRFFILKLKMERETGLSTVVSIDPDIIESHVDSNGRDAQRMKSEIGMRLAYRPRRARLC
jgi:hypothetical protein